MKNTKLPFSDKQKTPSQPLLPRLTIQIPIHIQHLIEMSAEEDVKNMLKKAYQDKIESRLNSLSQEEISRAIKDH